MPYPCFWIGLMVSVVLTNGFTLCNLKGILIFI